MNDFETCVEFLGEPRPCLVFFDPCHEIPIIKRVVVGLEIPHDYRPSGKYDPWIEWHELDVMNILSQEQIWNFVQEIRNSDPATA